ncbi:Cullin repeat-like-containing domain protein [Mycena sanguinolenta]|nr:Cullin repeat-like-containing domain protein [Mycena sanguinolenta]
MSYCQMSSVHTSAAAQPSAKSKDRYDTANVPHVWQTKLEPAITEIFDTGKGLDFPSYTSLYTDIYQCCTRSKSPTSMSSACPELYSRIVAFFEAYTAKINADAPDDGKLVVDYYDMRWARFQEGAVLVDRLFSYLNGYFVRPGKDMVPVLDVAVAQWKVQVFEPLLPRLEGAGVPLEAVRDGFASENLTAAKLKEMRIRVV